MLKEQTIKREMRRLRKIIDERPREAGTSDLTGREAYGAESALQWVLGGCTWTPAGLARKADA